MKINYIFNLISFILNCFYLKKYLHVFQLKDYNFKRFFNFFSKKHIVLWLFMLFLSIFQIFFKNFIVSVFCNVSILILNFTISYNLIKQNKTPIRYTKKLKRIYVLSIIILLFASLNLYGCNVGCLILFLTPALANFLNIYDKILNMQFIKNAKQKLQKFKPKIIAITGSNGKTSVKNILQKILNKKYSTLCCPKSYNTPLGLSKFINEADLSNCKFLILEYGARHKNDIQKLCRIFGADFGIVTSVAPQHLQTFKNMENIYNAKSKLPNYLKNKPCVFNTFNLYCYRMFLSSSQNNFGLDPYLDYTFNSNTLLTEIKIKLNNQTLKLKTKLLGEHNVINILLAIRLAYLVNVDTSLIKQAVSELDFTPHRLELIKTHINILDDSYNCSLTSAKCAVNVLNTFTGKKMVITPGIIEGGKFQYEINFKLGKLFKNTDYLIIVGNTNRQAILNGFSAVSNKKALICQNLDQAKQHLKLLNPNDTLLFLNDLPDDYN